MNIWEEASKRSSKNKPGECSKIWNDIKPNIVYTIGSLIHWAKTDCLEVYAKIRPTLNCIKVVYNDDKKYENVEIDTNYLVPVIGTEYNESQKNI